MKLNIDLGRIWEASYAVAYHDLQGRNSREYASAFASYQADFAVVDLCTRLGTPEPAKGFECFEIEVKDAEVAR